jgi:YD repeat-containing protein
VILKYQFSEKEYLDAQRLRRVHLAGTRLLYRMMPPVALGAAILGSYSILVANDRMLGLGLSAAALFLLYSRFFSWRIKARRAIAAHPELLGPFEIDLTERGVAIGAASPQPSSWMTWSECRRYYETKDLFLFAWHSVELLILPKRILPAGDMLHWVQVVRTELRGKGRRENPDAALLKFVISWVILGLFLFVLFIGSVHTFLTGGSQRNRYSYAAQTKPPVQDTKPAALNELEGRGTIYLVPMGKPQSLISSDLLAFYRQKYGLELKVLAPVAVPAWARDEVRNQLIAEELVEAMRRVYPQYANDPDAILIGITDQDMYISESKWQYAFSDRIEEKYAVISTARLDPVFWKQKPSPEDLARRLRKMLTKDIGLLYFHLQPSRNYSSALYDYIDDVEDLDDMGEDYLKTDAVVRAELHLEDGDPCFSIRHYLAPAKARVDAGSLTDCQGAAGELDLEMVDVDLRYGLLLARRIDFYKEDKIPLEFKRVLRTQDTRARAFGIGGTHNLNIFPVGDRWPFTWIDLIMAEGGRVHYKRSNWGFGYWDANYLETSWNGSEFSRSTITWNWPGWKLEETGGLKYYFADADYYSRPEQGALTGIQNEQGDKLTLDRDSMGNLLHARSPGRQWIDFKYDGANRMVQAQYSATDKFEYGYDRGGHLARVKDENGHLTDYSYDEKGRMTAIAVDGKPVVTVQFDSSDRVKSLALPDGRTYSFHYDLGRKGYTGAVEVADSQGPTWKIQMSGASQYTMQPVRSR